MELDDLRRQWQQPEPAATPSGFSEAALNQLLSRRLGGPVAKLRRNARWEALLVVLCLLGSVAALVVVADPFVRTMSGWLSIMCLLGVVYFRRKLVLLARLSETDQPLRGYVARQLGSLRSLVKLYYRATMWSLLPSLGIGLVLTAQRIAQQAGPQAWMKMSVLLLGYGVVGGLIYLVMRGSTAWYLQRLYGQHLDRLEGQLRELDDGALPTPH